MNHINDLSYSTPEDEEKQKILIHFRKKLHYALRQRISEWGWINTAAVLEKVKRIFLWAIYKAETSRSLDIINLKDAIYQAKILPEILIIETLKKRDEYFDLSDYRRLSLLQRKKIIRIMRYVIKMKEEAIRRYIKETIGRKTYIGNLSINEANQIIKRLEKWEANLSRKK